MALLLALICIFTIADPAVYAMGQEENEGQQTEQVQEDKQEQDSNAGGGTEQTGGDNGPDKNTNGDNGNGDPDKDDGDNGSGDPDKGDNSGNNDPDKDNDKDTDSDDNADPDKQAGDDTNKEKVEENENAAASVELFLAVNGVWKNVGTRSVNLDASTKRYYITAAELESVYGTYGFSAEDMSADLRIFPHTDKKNYDTIWANAKPYQTESGEWRIPLSTNIDNYLYYLPGNVDVSASFFDQKASRDDAAVLADNTFYTVSVSDTDGTETEGIGTYYVFNGGTFSITLSQREGYKWKITNPDTGAAIEPDETAQQDDGKVKYTFKAVTCPIKIMLADESKTTYIRYTITPRRLKRRGSSSARWQPQNRRFCMTAASPGRPSWRKQ